MIYSNIQKYNKLWETGALKTPVIILLGGYCGTGKTTLSNKIMKVVNYLNYLPTPIIRAAIRNYIPEETNPSLYKHTWKLYETGKPLDEEYIINRFTEQLTPITDAINQVIPFASTEKQNYIVDGNHVVAGFIKANPNIKKIEIYLKVSDPEVHRKLIGGPTHNRVLTEKEFKTGRIFQDFIVEQAVKNNNPVFEYDASYEKSLEYIDSELGCLIEEQLVTMTKVANIHLASSI